MKADYGWIILLAIVVIIVLCWKPIMGMFTTVSDKATNKEQVERGKLVYQDTKRWGGEDSYKSCAMCHDPGFQPEGGRKVEMADYTGEVYVLKGISKKYGSGILDTGDALYDRIMKCVTNPNRLSCGKISIRAPYLQDLMAYVSTL